MTDWILRIGIVIFVIALSAFGIYAIAKNAADCEAKGGVYVRSLTGYSYSCLKVEIIK